MLSGAHLIQTFHYKEFAMTMQTVQNHKAPRKQLSDQLDRLDSILDTLSEALNGAVADAAREGTRLALKDAVVEIMTDPTLRAKLHQASAPDTPDQTTARSGSILARIKARVGEAAKGVGRWVSNLAERGKARARQLARTACETLQAVRGLGSMRNLALVGLGAGATLAVVGLVAPHAVAAGLSGVCGGVAAVAVQIGVWTRRTVRALTAA
jgi:hypothetical protein